MYVNIGKFFSIENMYTHLWILPYFTFVTIESHKLREKVVDNIGLGPILIVFKIVV
jgi:hypothetical protein